MKLLILAATTLALAACATETAPLPWNPVEPETVPSLALYSNDNLLLTAPIEDWELRSRIAGEKGESFTDVYFVIHGWNYTHQEAIANEFGLVHEIYQAKPPRGTQDFRPHVIYVAWSSVSRPFQESARSILPYGIDETVQPVAGMADTVAFHLPSIWQQSIKATKVAAGRRPAASYEEDDYDQADLIEVRGSSLRAGRDLPLSVVLRKAIELTRSTNSPVRGQRIHVVGHSFGAKVATLASIEALEEYFLLMGDSPDPNAIESLTLINAAFNPSEVAMFRYSHGTPLRSFRLKHEIVQKHLAKIPRKVSIYSRRDHATARIFPISQTVFNVNQAQYVDTMIATIRENVATLLPGFREIGSGGLSVAGVAQFPWNVGTGAAAWSWYTVVELPTDWAHHVVSNDTFGTSTSEVVKWPLNAVHFFVPLDKLLTDAPSCERGLFRPTFAALGGSSIGCIAAGRPKWTPNAESLLPLTDGDDEIDAEEFAAIACGGPSSPRLTALAPSTFYSADGSKVLDSWFSLDGSHSDLYSEDMASVCGTPPENKVSKREAMVRFLIAFTRE